MLTQVLSERRINQISQDHPQPSPVRVLEHKNVISCCSFCCAESLQAHNKLATVSPNKKSNPSLFTILASFAVAFVICVKKTPFQIGLKHYVKKGKDQMLEKDKNSSILFLPATDVLTWGRGGLFNFFKWQS